MAGDKHGTETQEEPQAQEDIGQQQAAKEQPQVNDKDWEKAIAERDEKIAALEAQVAEAAKNAETAEQLRVEIAELKAQGESDRIDFKLQLSGVRNVKAARAMLGDYDGDVDAPRLQSRGFSPTRLPHRSLRARLGSPTRAPAPTRARR